MSYLGTFSLLRVDSVRLEQEALIRIRLLKKGFIEWKVQLRIREARIKDGAEEQLREEQRLWEEARQREVMKSLEDAKKREQSLKQSLDTKLQDEEADALKREVH